MLGDEKSELILSESSAKQTTHIDNNKRTNDNNNNNNNEVDVDVDDDERNLLLAASSRASDCSSSGHRQAEVQDEEASRRIRLISERENVVLGVERVAADYERERGNNERVIGALRNNAHHPMQIRSRSSDKQKKLSSSARTDNGQADYCKRKMLAKQESVFNDDDNDDEFDAEAATTKAKKQSGPKTKGKMQTKKQNKADGCCNLRFVCFVLLPLVLICSILVVYCVPFIEIDTRTIQSDSAHRLESIPFNFRDGPLQASDANLFKMTKLFEGQLYEAESVALDSSGNMYLAVSGGFILYAHLNKSSARKRSYYDYYATKPMSASQQPPSSYDYLADAYLPDLVKIAELNAIKQLPNGAIAADGTSVQQQAYTSGPRATNSRQMRQASSWRRECQLDEQLYGSQLYEPHPSTSASAQQQQTDALELARRPPFKSNVAISRCSVPLGIRLSPDERHLYVIDTLSGLYRVSLRTPEKPYSSQRLVQRLIDFRANRGHLLLPMLGLNYSLAAPTQAMLNITLRGVDDLAIEFGAGSNGGDLIYLSDASQNWPAHSFIYDLLEQRPSSRILRFDTGSNQLVVLDPHRLSHVRLAAIELDEKIRDAKGTDYISNSNNAAAAASAMATIGLGAPRFDENDIFDERPLHFANGLELTDDRQALLIADTVNKRILKHYLRGARTSTTDLWTWTPNFPDNIRRGYDKRVETYWVAGCGQDPDASLFDMVHLLEEWPRVRKYLLKNIYLIGWLLEQLGSSVFRSDTLRDLGYSMRDGSIISELGCPGMMLIQYNKHGDIVRSVHGSNFPTDLKYYSQVNELVDAQSEQHILYLSSPSYSFVTKLILPSSTTTNTDPVIAPTQSNTLAYK